MKIWDYKPGTMGPHSGQTGLNRVFRGTHCDNCGGVVNRPPSQCRGKTVSCSPACAGMLRRVRVKNKCVICGTEMLQIPSHTGFVVTCSETCRKARRAYDSARTAPRPTPTKETRSQFCSARGLTRSQFRHRSQTGQSLDAPLVHECGVKEEGTDRAWESLSACARDLGVSVTAVHNAIKRGGSSGGVKLVRTTPPMNRGK